MMNFCLHFQSYFKFAREKMLKLEFLFSLYLIFASASADVEISPTIVGGNDASPGQFPHMVSIQNAAIRGR